MSSMSSRIEREADNVRAKASETASTVTSAAREIASDVADVAKHRAGEMADAARTHAREVSDSVGEIGSQFRSAFERSLERQPLTTVLLAVAAGVVLGGILRR